MGNNESSEPMTKVEDINEEVEKIIDNNDAEEAKRKIEELLEKWKIIPLHIGIVGKRGAGKSSFINNISGEQLAKIGVKETTTQVTEYKHPDNKQLSFWDMPGFLANKYKTVDAYFEAMGPYIKRFDIILFLYKDCFEQPDLQVYTKLQEITKNNTPVFIVRSKFDNDIRGGKDGGKDEEEVKEDIQSELTQSQLTAKCYFIANRKQVPNSTQQYQFCHDYDYDMLMEDITKNLSEPKRDALFFTLRAPNEKILQMKKRQLEKRIVAIATAAGGIGAIPVPGIDVITIGIIIKQITFMANVLGISTFLHEHPELEFVCKCASYQTKLGLFDLIRGVKTLGVTFVAMFADDVIKLTVPVVGIALSASVSILLTKNLLTQILNDFVEVAKIKMQTENEQQVLWNNVLMNG